MFTFQYIWLLLLLGLLPVLWYLQGSSVKRAHKPLSLATQHRVPNKRTWRVKVMPFLPVFKYAALASCIIALARPQRVDVLLNKEGQGIDIILALDISPSMLARDFKPDRLAVAKRVARNFVHNRAVDRIGLVSFAGEAIVEYPLTTDHSIIEKRIDAMVVGELADGTAIGMGLGTALTRLRDTSTQSRVVILMTDGENNSGYYSPQQAIDIATQLGVKVYTIGVGTDDLAEAPIARNIDGSYEFAQRRLTIDENLLRAIADSTGGQYFAATSEDMLASIYEKIDAMEKSNYETEEMILKKEYFHYPVLLALLLLAVEAVMKWVFLRSVHNA